ncbi:hypothetical protein [Amycolatopsis sp. SID8362]|uniref:hypothetical protein n=1 Tax=Amycolatopsis sp. SID8362 TaxID=2690346 RepID=UPI00136E5882|nr:hypothetical protein [Amycolatopsis sp. SID8362]NBH10356.1 hypothetical protein [Amycolatopsis sp. SID8362]NED47051.1 hypothetical protein [Amycolatopsis sp. SID8362]
MLALDEVNASHTTIWRSAESLSGPRTGRSDLVRLYAPPAAVGQDPLTELLTASAKSQKIIEGVDDDPHLVRTDRAVRLPL